MSLPLPISCILMGLLGLVSSTLLILRSLNRKATAANLIFTPKSYFKDDWYTPVASIVAVIMAFILLPYEPKTWSPAVTLILFGTIGYMGSDISSRVFSVASNKLNAAIGFKSQISDSSTGTTDAPTPAAPPTPKP